MSQKALYYTGRTVMQLLAKLAMRMDVAQTGPLPAGAKIIAPNHPTTIDPFLMTTLTNDQVHILVTESAFKVPVFGRYLRAAGHIAVVAGNGRAAMDEAARLLADGKCLAIFPEGALSPLAGGGSHAHTGVARLALLTGAPVIPVGIALEPEHIRLLNTGIANANGQAEIARLYAGGRYAVTIGTPLHLAGDVEDRPYVRALTDQLMQRIERLAQCSAGRLNRPTAPDSGAFARIGQQGNAR
jgi:1-acyl-sn-glycerol-3-phosphate acyltransferase